MGTLASQEPLLFPGFLTGEEEICSSFDLILKLFRVSDVKDFDEASDVTGVTDAVERVNLEADNGVEVSGSTLAEVLGCL